MNGRMAVCWHVLAGFGTHFIVRQINIDMNSIKLESLLSYHRWHCVLFSFMFSVQVFGEQFSRVSRI